MRRLALLCLLSLAAYAASFGLLLGRGMDGDYLRALIEAKLARGRAIAGPKLVILAGSNALYSHRCATIEPMLALPCVNAGVAVGIGLDYLFARWQPLLHAGDVVYMPMEARQYTRSRAATERGPEAAILFRHDRAALAALGVRRFLAGLFAFDLRAGVDAVADAAMAAAGVHDPRWTAGEVNAWGDRVGHTAARARANRDFVLHLPPDHVSAAGIAAGYGTALIAAFVAQASARGVTVIGGLPTGFTDDPPDADTVAAIRAVFVDHHGRFLELPGRSRYPRTCFYDSADHLDEACQMHHSVRLAMALAIMLHRDLLPPADDPPCGDQPPAARPAADGGPIASAAAPPADAAAPTAADWPAPPRQ